AVYAERDATGSPAIERALATGESAVEFADGRVDFGISLDALALGAQSPSVPMAFLRPLQVRDHTVGVLRIARSRGLRLTPEQRRVLDALSYYAALGVERVRLVAEAQRAATLQEAHRVK